MDFDRDEFLNNLKQKSQLEQQEMERAIGIFDRTRVAMYDLVRKEADMRQQLTEIERLQQISVEAQAKYEKLEQENATLTSLTERLEYDVGDIQERYSQAKKDAQAVQCLKQKVEQESQKLQQEYASLKNLFDQTVLQNKGLEESQEELRQSVKSLEQMLEFKNREIHELEEKAIADEDDYAQLYTESGIYEQRVYEHEEEIFGLKKLNESLQFDLEKATQKWTEDQKHLKILLSEQQKLRSGVTKLEEDLNKEHAASLELKKTINEFEKSLKSKEIQISSERENHNLQIGAHKQEIETLKTQLSKFESEFQEVTSFAQSEGLMKKDTSFIK